MKGAKWLADLVKQKRWLDSAGPMWLLPNSHTHMPFIACLFLFASLMHQQLLMYLIIWLGGYKCGTLLIALKQITWTHALPASLPTIDTGI